MRHIYDVGYSTYEESCYWQFSKAGSKLDAAELRVFVRECILEAWRDPDRKDYMESFQDLMGSDAFRQGMESRGFRPMEFAAMFSVFGWAKAAKPGDWSVNGDDLELQEWIRDQEKAETP